MMQGVFNIVKHPKCNSVNVVVNRTDRPRGSSRVQRLPALARRESALGRSKLRQGQGHGGDEHRPLLFGPQDALVASGHLWARRPPAPHPARAPAVDLPLSGTALPGAGAQKQPQPGRRLRRGCDSCNVSVNTKREQKLFFYR